MKLIDKFIEKLHSKELLISSLSVICSIIFVFYSYYNYAEGEYRLLGVFFFWPFFVIPQSVLYILSWMNNKYTAKKIFLLLSFIPILGLFCKFGFHIDALFLLNIFLLVWYGFLLPKKSDIQHTKSQQNNEQKIINQYYSQNIKDEHINPEQQNLSDSFNNDNNNL